MAKQKQRLLERMAGSVKPTADVVTLPRGDVTASPRRQDRPHVSLYLGKATQRELKQIALTLNRRPHDIYIEGIELVLKHYGRKSIEEIEGN